MMPRYSKTSEWTTIELSAGWVRVEKSIHESGVYLANNEGWTRHLTREQTEALIEALTEWLDA